MSRNDQDMSGHKRARSLEKPNVVMNRIEEGESCDNLEEQEKSSYRESEVGSKLNRGIAHIQVKC